MGIVIADYDADWPAAYEEERTKLAGAFGEHLVDIQHMGSTSVPELAAKPVIDIIVAIDSYPLSPQAIKEVERLGYEHKGEYGISGRHYFRKGNPRTFHVHVYEIANEEWDSHILFRDYLRANPQAAREYEALKHDLAARLGHDGELYTDGKTEFVQNTLSKARAWREAGKVCM